MEGKSKEELVNTMLNNMVVISALEKCVVQFVPIICMHNTPVKEVKLEKSFKIVHNISGGDIYFRDIGAPLKSGTIRILDNETNKYCEITIVPATGRVLLKNRIFEGYIKK